MTMLSHIDTLEERVDHMLLASRPCRTNGASMRLSAGVSSDTLDRKLPAPTRGPAPVQRCHGCCRHFSHVKAF